MTDPAPRPRPRPVGTTRRPGRRRRAALLSALAFPGAGQMANGHPWRALAFGGGTLVAAAVLVRRVAQETLARMPQDPLDIDLGLPLRLAAEIHRANARFFFWITLVVVLLWIGSIVDAWYGARES